jgi:hypothetical protein
MADTTTTELDEAARRAQAASNYDKATIPFYISLGRFLHQYSLLETAMLTVLIGVSGVTLSVGKSIYSGTRIGTAKSYINRILDATDRAALKEQLRPYFDQIGLINSMRDEVLHYGATYDFSKNALIVSNERVAHTPDKLRRIEVNPQLLDDLRHDTLRAYCGVLLCWVGGSSPPDARKYFESVVASPWRYKQPPLVPPDPETP